MSMLEKITPANIIALAMIVAGLTGTFYLSLDKIESHEQRITRLENAFNEFEIEYARNEAEEDAADRYLELQIQHIMEK